MNNDNEPPYSGKGLHFSAFIILVTTLSVAFPCIEYYSVEALVNHALALKHQHLWCLTVTIVLHVVSVQLSTSMELYNFMVFGAFCHAVSQFLRLGCVLYVTALEAYWYTEASAALLLSLIKQLVFNH